MITTIAFSLGIAVCSAADMPRHEVFTIHDSQFTIHSSGVDSSYKALYESGATFADFVSRASARKEQWEGNYAKGVAPDALVTRATAAGTGWKLLVVAVSGCSDSVNSIPYVASFLDKVPSIEMRLISPTVGKAVQEAHRTPDGRAATPTVILLDGEFNERGCWIERPANLIALMSGQKDSKSSDEIFTNKMEWYDKDRGASSLEEIVAMIEAAAGGGKKCGSN